MRLQLPGVRPLDATRDGTDGNAVVVACPPHPQLGGDRTDARLRAVSDALATHIDCLRFDYGTWDGGNGEQTDVRTALSWATEEYETVGLFGYSFGAAVALAALAPDAVGEHPLSESTLSLAPPQSVAVLAPAADIHNKRVLAGIDAARNLLVVYGERDETVDAASVVARASERGHTVEAVAGDHFFVGQRVRIGRRIAAFFAETLWS